MRSLLAASALLLMAPVALSQSAGRVAEPRFEIEDADASDTRVWLSGLAYGLTGYGVALETAGRARFFCLPGDESVDASMLVEILNQRADGQMLSAEAATTEAIRGLQARFPCRD